MYENEPEKKVSKGLNVPTAILLAGALIAGSYYFVNRSHVTTPNRDNTATVLDGQNLKTPVDPVTKEDHLLGNPQAKIVLIEYSDLECPYCKVFHKTMKKVMEDYAKDGTVAWVYRHFPLDTLHSKARKEAEAAECAAELGGNTAFWDFIDSVYDITPSNNNLDASQLGTVAVKIGLEKSEFQSCLDSGKHADKVEADYQSGLKAGTIGTPNTFLISTGNDIIPIEGAESYSAIKGLINTILTTSAQN